LCVGDKPDGKPWYIGIVDPNDTEKRIGALALNGNWCISTSGDYERYFMQGDKKYHHIIDPATGYPTDNGIRSVTIVSKSGFISDALSTACFVLGKEKGMALAAQYGAEILIVDAAGEITMSEGLNSIFYDVNSLKP
ncbi:MAG: FAD:protein FMN transferase, partial [Lachnospiraceae bacterium]|nr:FAD:protein FMN transferase [Lachnospiraceae bacterium]